MRTINIQLTNKDYNDVMKNNYQQIKEMVNLELSGKENENDLRDLLSCFVSNDPNDIIGLKDSFNNYFTLPSIILNQQIDSNKNKTIYEIVLKKIRYKDTILGNMSKEKNIIENNQNNKFYELKDKNIPKNEKCDYKYEFINYSGNLNFRRKNFLLNDNLNSNIKEDIWYNYKELNNKNILDKKSTYEMVNGFQNKKFYQDNISVNKNVSDDNNKQNEFINPNFNENTYSINNIDNFNKKTNNNYIFIDKEELRNETLIKKEILNENKDFCPHNMQYDNNKFKKINKNKSNKIFSQITLENNYLEIINLTSNNSNKKVSNFSDIKNNKKLDLSNFYNSNYHPKSYNNNSKKSLSCLNKMQSKSIYLNELIDKNNQNKLLKIREKESKQKNLNQQQEKEKKILDKSNYTKEKIFLHLENLKKRNLFSQ